MIYGCLCLVYEHEGTHVFELLMLNTSQGILLYGYDARRRYHDTTTFLSAVVDLEQYVHLLFEPAASLFL